MCFYVVIERPKIQFLLLSTAYASALTECHNFWTEEKGQVLCYPAIHKFKCPILKLVPSDLVLQGWKYCEQLYLVLQLKTRKQFAKRSGNDHTLLPCDTEEFCDFLPGTIFLCTRYIVLHAILRGDVINHQRKVSHISAFITEKT